MSAYGWFAAVNLSRAVGMTAALPWLRADLRVYLRDARAEPRMALPSRHRSWPAHCRATGDRLVSLTVGGPTLPKHPRGTPRDTCDSMAAKCPCHFSAPSLAR